MPAPRVRAHSRRRARGHARPRHRSTGHDHRSTVATAGPMASHRNSHPTLSSTRRTLTGRAKPTCAAQPTALPSYLSSARARRRHPHRPCLDSCGLRVLVVTSRHELLFKGRSSPVTRVAAGHRAVLRHTTLKARYRAPPSTCSPSQGTLLALALDRPEARALACCLGRATPSPALEFQRPPSSIRR
jgi:hypothetical protein